MISEDILAEESTLYIYRIIHYLVFLCGIDGKVLTASEYNNLGAFYNGKVHVANGSESFWVNQNGAKVTAAS